MKKIIISIFAHPDDEAFGPSGYLLMSTKSGHDVHLICLTAGQTGENPDNLPDLAVTRLKEWHSAGKLIGAKSMHHLELIDGELCNNLFHEAAAKVEKIVKEIIISTGPSSVEFLSTDDNGITGHLDHIFASRLSAYIFYRLKPKFSSLQMLKLVCIPEARAPEPNLDYMYMSPGRKEHEIDEVVDTRQYQKDIIKIIRAHQSQRGDGENHIKRLGKDLGQYYFRVLR